jgi:hypothetical protein
MKMPGRLLFPCLVGLTFTVSCGTISNGKAADNIQPQTQAVDNKNSNIDARDYSKLLSKAQTTGSLPVIVRLNIPFVPEGRLATAQEAVNQQGQIAKMQDQLCTALSKYNVQGIKRFKYTPYIAMEVDLPALKALISNPLVLSIQEDVPVPPAIH